MTDTPNFRYIGKPRQPSEDRRFVAGHGRFAADVAIPQTKHVALVSSPWAAARIVDIDIGAAAKSRGVCGLLTGREIAQSTTALATGVDTPAIQRWPLAVDVVRYAGEWVVAIIADSRAEAEDAAELVEIDYEELPFVLDPEQAFDPASSPVHAAHGSNVLLHRSFTWGEVDRHSAESDHRLQYRVHWKRSSTVPLETFAVTAKWEPWRQELEIWASIQMPKFSEQIARAMRLPQNAVKVHYDVDVGGSYGVKRGLKHTVLVAELSRRFGYPVRLIEDRLENMSGGDAHGPDRIFDVEMAYDGDGRVNSMRMRALDNAGAYTGRAAFQLGKPVSAIVGPYRIRSVAYEAISVTTNITPQEAVRGFGQAPTNYAIERGIDLVAEALDRDRLDVRRRNLIRADQFPYTIPSGSTYDSGDYHALVDKTCAAAGGWDGLMARRDKLRSEGWLAGVGLSTCLEPSGGNSSFEPLLNPKNDTTTWMESCAIHVDGTGSVTATMSTTTSGQGHETLLSTVVGEVLHIDPDQIRVARATSQSGHATNSPVGSRMAVMLGGAAAKAAEEIRDKFRAIAAQEFDVALDDTNWRDAGVDGPSGQRLDWMDLVHICHRNAHRLAAGQQPGISAIHTLQVPTGGALPDAQNRIQIYPCYALEVHLLLMRMDRILCKPEILDYWMGHDCGVEINPHIVRGMSLGGIAHGLGAALMEQFRVDASGQPQSLTLLDYPMPSVHEVPRVDIIKQCTPSPLTAFGQKGSGESGYLGAPAAIAGAVNDALSPSGARIDHLPMRMSEISDIVAAAEGRS